MTATPVLSRTTSPDPHQREVQPEVALGALVLVADGDAGFNDGFNGVRNECDGVERSCCDATRQVGM
ncbi:hypothetical protein JY439_04690 [Stenotrophomonas maltophilia]|uniref:hypothetical protein n=1 Tax=Stenotrophomonas geniculata TaxID=86188 RepID=UPI001072193F|nr:hypothetical protein [Stenotrophomonas geniculata]MBN4969762.1 hypothetical protein [Stenotrophomonas maltophilia]MDP9618806.1 hypothetical protein [Stenotrophomonas maltophilia]